MPDFFQVIFGCILAEIQPSPEPGQLCGVSEMSQLAEDSNINLAESRTSNSGIATSLISAHGPVWGSNAFFGAAASVISGVIVGTLGWPPAFYFAAGLFFIGFLASLMMPRTDAGRPTVA